MLNPEPVGFPPLDVFALKEAQQQAARQASASPEGGILQKATYESPQEQAARQKLEADKAQHEQNLEASRQRQQFQREMFGAFLVLMLVGAALWLLVRPGATDGDRAAANTIITGAVGLIGGYGVGKNTEKK